MFDDLPETRSKGRILAPRSFSTAVIGHGAVLAVIVAGTLLARVPAGADPPPPYDPVITIEIPKGDNMQAGGGGTKPEPPPVKKPPEPLKNETTQPVVVPELPPPEPTPEPPAPAPTPDVPPADATEGSGGGSGGGKGTGHGPGVGPGDEDGTFGDPKGTGTEMPDQVPDGPIIVEGDVQAPVLIHRVEPEYPEIARHARKEGDVILQAIVGTDGRVESVTVLRSQPLLDKAAIKAVSQWIYRPSVLHGRPVKVFITVFVKFRLD